MSTTISQYGYYWLSLSATINLPTTETTNLSTFPTMWRYYVFPQSTFPTVPITLVSFYGHYLEVKCRPKCPTGCQTQNNWLELCIHLVKGKLLRIFRQQEKQSSDVLIEKRQNSGFRFAVFEIAKNDSRSLVGDGAGVWGLNENYDQRTGSPPLWKAGYENQDRIFRAGCRGEVYNLLSVCRTGELSVRGNHQPHSGCIEPPQNDDIKFSHFRPSWLTFLASQRARKRKPRNRPPLFPLATGMFWVLAKLWYSNGCWFFFFCTSESIGRRGGWGAVKKYEKSGGFWVFFILLKRKIFISGTRGSFWKNRTKNRVVRLPKSQKRTRIYFLCGITRA